MVCPVEVLINNSIKFRKVQMWVGVCVLTTPTTTVRTPPELLKVWCLNLFSGFLWWLIEAVRLVSSKSRPILRSHKGSHIERIFSEIEQHLDYFTWKRHMPHLVFDFISSKASILTQHWSSLNYAWFPTEINSQQEYLENLKLSALRGQIAKGNFSLNFAYWGIGWAKRASSFHDSYKFSTM